ncbi:hypothetical protein [Rathayibacter tanaceti]|uniref:Uncharacterized protein n=1 Tax=Rathayibacter tanaceti TaxID=1671680 RepID=A0A166HYT5_9MICO|nr:hypothetical protein [Rathayibacter tanaceti]KZX21362.1 hypothetical protein ACH61_01504 [Rathayibacter tanaceti]
MIASAEQKHLLDRIAPLLARLGRTRDEIEDAPVLLGRNLTPAYGSPTATTSS